MNSSETRIIQPKYGRLLDDFHVGDIYHHPWEVTIDDGMLAMFAASFVGMRGRPRGRAAGVSFGCTTTSLSRSVCQSHNREEGNRASLRGREGRDQKGKGHDC